MKTLHLFTLAIAFTLALASSISAQSVPPPAKPEQQQASASSVEIAVLKAQLETTKQFQESFISMAQWTLGAAVAIALAMGAYAWHTNKTNYDRDRESLSREIKALSAELRTEVQLDLAKHLKTLEDGLSSREKDITATVTKAAEIRIAVLKEKLSEMNSSLLDLQESELSRQAQHWTDTGVHSNALSTLAELLELQTKRDLGEYFLSDTLERMMKLSSDQSKKVGADTISNVVAAIEKLPKTLRSAADPIVEKLKKKLG